MEKNCPPIVFDIWDRDSELLMTRDFMGRACIKLSEASYDFNVLTSDNLPDPTWHPIRMGMFDTEPSKGEVLCSFSVIRQLDDSFESIAQVIDVTPESNEYMVDINVLGLRNV